MFEKYVEELVPYYQMPLDIRLAEIRRETQSVKFTQFLGAEAAIIRTLFLAFLYGIRLAWLVNADGGPMFHVCAIDKVVGNRCSVSLLLAN